jgi:signal transduction histidine kinase/DNA-binding response OmpR family regulator
MGSDRILIVDDEPHIVDLCVQILDNLGYDVQGVTRGLDAQKLLESETFDLLLADIQMPDLDGLAVLRRGRELDPNLTSVFITGYGTMDRAIEALRAGARGFILKPFDIDELISAVQEALAQRRQEQEHLYLQAQVPVLEISQAMLAEGDVASLAARLLEVVLRQTDGVSGLLGLRSGNGDDLDIVAEIGLPEHATNEMEDLLPPEAVARAFSAEEPLVLDQASLASLRKPWRLPGEGSGSCVFVLVPLRTGKKKVGVLALCCEEERERGRALTPVDLNRLSIVGGQIAIALENARMYAVEQQRAVELARALAQQKELDELKDEFIRNVSHELRTPLSMIVGYSELMASGDLGAVDPEQEEPLQVILQRALILRDLVDNITAMLDSSGRTRLWVLVSMVDLARMAVADFQIMAREARLVLRGEIDAKVPPVLGDQDHLRRVIDNLVENAIKFTQPGGEVIVRLTGDGHDVQLEVTDTGIGIGVEHQKRIFERFYQVDGTVHRTYGGCGLGLALVREIVETHGGRISVESRLGQGSTFKVRFPPAEAS